MGKCQSEFATELRTPQTGIPCSVTPITRQPKSTAGLQLLFDQLFTWPTDQPRHATLIDDDPVKSDRPRFRWKIARERLPTTVYIDNKEISRFSFVEKLGRGSRPYF
jgi:hypothetical protein